MSSSIFSRANHTELHQLCLNAGLRVGPNDAKETMIAYLEGEAEPPEASEEEYNVVNAWRGGLIRFAEAFWKHIATQITCPMKDLKSEAHPNPKPCYGCLDQQVIACVVSNAENEKRINNFRLNVVK